MLWLVSQPADPTAPSEPRPKLWMITGKNIVEATVSMTLQLFLSHLSFMGFFSPVAVKLDLSSLRRNKERVTKQVHF